MKISEVLTILKTTASMLVIALAIPLGQTAQRLMRINYTAEYTVEIPIGSLMTSIGTFCLVSMLLLIGGWGIIASILPETGETALAEKRQLEIIILVVLLVLLIGMAIVGVYFGQKADRWS
jgi:heme/copper-type cytochrome/quinol oxidase subunit 2